MKKQLMYILFYGGLWGFLEATIGHFLHLIPTTIAGSFMFPIASVILIQAYVTLQSKRSLIYIALVAAAIKSVDFFLPALSVYKTINPMVSFVIEALLVVVVVRYITKEPAMNKMVSFQVASVGWRIAFIGYMAILTVTTGLFVPYFASLQTGVEFVLIQGILSGFLALGLYYVVKLLQEKQVHFKLHPALSAITILLALVATYYL